MVLPTTQFIQLWTSRKRTITQQPTRFISELKICRAPDEVVYYLLPSDPHFNSYIDYSNVIVFKYFGMNKIVVFTLKWVIALLIRKLKSGFDAQLKSVVKDVLLKWTQILNGCMNHFSKILTGFKSTLPSCLRVVRSWSTSISFAMQIDQS